MSKWRVRRKKFRPRPSSNTALLAAFAEVEQKGTTMPYTCVNGNMFSFLTNDGTLALCLSVTDRATFLLRYDTGLVEQHGAVMEEYVAVPGALLANTEELTPLFVQSLAYATSLKPKLPSAKKRAVTEFASTNEWETWLGEHHAEPAEVWVKIPKKGTPANLISYDDAVEVALCYGWIDSQAAKFDDGYWLQRFTPRRTKSPWSKINRSRAEKLIEQGKMQPPGLQEVHRAPTGFFARPSYALVSARTACGHLNERGIWPVLPGFDHRRPGADRSGDDPGSLRRQGVEPTRKSPMK